MRTIKNMLASDSAATVQLTAGDLLDFAHAMAEEMKEELKDIIVNSGLDEKVTVKEAMAMLHKGRKTLWRWNKSGVLKVHKEGRSVYYRKADVLDILQNGTQGDE